METENTHQETPPRRINVELLDRIERQITEHPETWDQDVWFRLPERSRETQVVEPPCGTACCVAGWSAVLSGYKLAIDAGHDEGGTCVSPEGERRYIDAVARELLGLTPDEANSLFETDNSIETVRDIFADLRAEAGASE